MRRKELDLDRFYMQFRCCIEELISSGTLEDLDTSYIRALVLLTHLYAFHTGKCVGLGERILKVAESSPDIKAVLNYFDWDG